MRKFKNLEKQRQKELTLQFPDLYKLSCVEETPYYKYLAISVFDHWLGCEEAIKLIDNVPMKEQLKRNEALYLFSQKLAAETEIINFKFCGTRSKVSPLFREFTSEQAKVNYLNPTLSDPNKPFFQMVLPELSMVFYESWDDTNVLYLRDESVEDSIKKWASECGVHCLEQ